ncbi:uncharacterized protein E0L32_009781 [Thyridium curvatum]|uniref:LCCL domain-containing protein n=1 Tax=Thyridium curvatum TaxID=1093900 RepID=A0A507AUV6_9PEZI|nr:uncharacterized protein E0L32_009781 [Thyridium curvatum]TPX08719.1 hypothetical protein E0L32_009781 [Thyridium curvatum]
MGNQTHPVDSTVEEDQDLEQQRRHTTAHAASSSSGNIEPDDPIAPSAAPDGAALSELEQDSRPSTPRFIQDEGSWKRWKWVPYPVRRALRAAARWAQGPPDGGRPWRIHPIFPEVQHWPIKLLDRRVPRRRHRAGLVVLWLGLWLMTFALVMRAGLQATEIAGWGEPGDIGCGNTYWVSGNGCGVNGNDCRPFNGSGFAFRCPSSCLSYQVLNPRAVGDQEINYAPLIIGGPPRADSDAAPVYRGDSFICAAAVHAGVISNARGGCGVVSLVGQQSGFVASVRNGASSFGFDSYFPLSFTFEEGIDCEASDNRWALLGVSVAFSIVFSIFVSSPALFFFSIFSGVFWHVGLASDPPPHSTVPALLSNLLGKYLPAMLAAWVIYDRMGVRRALTGLTAQLEKTFFWLGACWFGALENVSFSWIPISRLTSHDLNQQPGAKAALAFIVIILVCVAASQIWYFRQEARLVKYLQLYVLFVAGLLLMLALPDLNLRIHHYILALLLLPGTSMQTRPCLLYQGLLVGLFINGVTRWGWDSILQTAYALQGDSQTGSPLPDIAEPVISLASSAATAAAATGVAAAAAAAANLSTITFTWGPPPPGPRYDGISVLVNDVERFRHYFADGEDIQALSAVDGRNDSDTENKFVWRRRAGERVNEYFRFAYMEGSQSWDYTKAGVWNEGGEWVEMKAGPSRVKARRGLEKSRGGGAWKVEGERSEL